MAERLLSQAFESLEGRDPQLADTVVQADKAIDRLQKEIEEQAISMIARPWRTTSGTSLQHCA